MIAIERLLESFKIHGDRKCFGSSFVNYAVEQRELNHSSIRPRELQETSLESVAYNDGGRKWQFINPDLWRKFKASAVTVIVCSRFKGTLQFSREKNSIPLHNFLSLTELLNDCNQHLVCVHFLQFIISSLMFSINQV